MQSAPPQDAVSPALDPTVVYHAGTLAHMQQRLRPLGCTVPRRAGPAFAKGYFKAGLPSPKYGHKANPRLP